MSSGLLVSQVLALDEDNGGGMEKEEIAREESFAEKDGHGAATLPGINFSTFILSLNSSALVHLGIIMAPGACEKSVNLPLAKQTVDILGMLEDKTRGNLIDDEKNLLTNMLHDLRLMYVKLKEQMA